MDAQNRHAWAVISTHRLISPSRPAHRVCIVSTHKTRAAAERNTRVNWRVVRSRDVAWIPRVGTFHVPPKGWGSRR